MADGVQTTFATDEFKAALVRHLTVSMGRRLLRRLTIDETSMSDDRVIAFLESSKSGDDERG